MQVPLIAVFYKGMRVSFYKLIQVRGKVLDAGGSGVIPYCT